MQPIDKKLWDTWRDAVGSRIRLSGIDREENATVFGFADDQGQSWSTSIRRYRRYSLGVDVVGYTKRSFEGQLFLTTSILVAIDAATKGLQKISWISRNDPEVNIPTGDGAILLFESLQSAFAMLFTINMFIEDMNRGPFGGVDDAVEREQGYPILPAEVRYALAVGEVANITATADVPNAVGRGVSDCARILSASKGAHLLIQDEVMRELTLQGGLNEVAQQGNPWNWGQRLFTARMPERKVKSGTFCFHNVFGTYNKLALIREATKKELEGPERLYDIGSHDVTTIPA